MEQTIFEPGEKIHTVSGRVGYVVSRTHWKWYISYSIWDWKENYQTMDEWMIKKYEEDKIGFSENNS